MNGTHVFMCCIRSWKKEVNGTFVFLCCILSWKEVVFANGTHVFMCCIRSWKEGANDTCVFMCCMYLFMKGGVRMVYIYLLDVCMRWLNLF